MRRWLPYVAALVLPWLVLAVVVGLLFWAAPHESVLDRTGECPPDTGEFECALPPADGVLAIGIFFGVPLCAVVTAVALVMVYGTRRRKVRRQVLAAAPR